MPRCLYCGNEFQTLKEGETRILFCRRQCRLEYKRTIINKLHDLNDLQLMILNDLIQSGFLNCIIDSETWENIKEEFGLK